ACTKYLLKSESFMPQTILRNAVRSAAPAATTIGATDLPLSHRLRSDKKILRSSAMLRFSIGLEPFTITTIGSPAPAAGTTINRYAARIPATNLSDGFAIVIITVSLEGKREFSRHLVPARYSAPPIAVILELHASILGQLMAKSGCNVAFAADGGSSIVAVVDRVTIVSVLPRISHVRAVAVKA